LLVGHSYGGAVITEAGSDPKVAGLVYVSAVAPDKGESALGLITSVPTPIGTELRPDKSGFLKLTHKGIAEDFAQDLSAKAIAILTATQVPASVAAMKGEVMIQPGRRSHRGTSSLRMIGRFHQNLKQLRRRKSARQPPLSLPVT
jgi:pimeloyl-ACP methyl ester carboxylesterase